MVEDFKTNVSESDQARWLLDEINKRFQSYTANFDLDDCDHILRIETLTGSVDVLALVKLMEHSGFQAELLSDEIISFTLNSSLK